MTDLRHPHHRSWLTLAVLAGTLWVIADSSTRGTKGEVGSTAASDITGGLCGGPSEVPAASPTGSTPDGILCAHHSRPPAVPISNTNQGVEHRPLVPASAHSDGSGSPVRVAGSRRRTIPGSHKRIVVCSATGVAGDPNDDGTSGDPDEDDDNETSKFLDSDDNSDVACLVWLHEMGPYLIADQCAFLTGPAHLSAPFPMLQQLRC